MQKQENNGTPEGQDPITRVTTMLERPKIMDALQQQSKDFPDAKVTNGTATSCASG